MDSIQPLTVTRHPTHGMTESRQPTLHHRTMNSELYIKDHIMQYSLWRIWLISVGKIRRTEMKMTVFSAGTVPSLWQNVGGKVRGSPVLGALCPGVPWLMTEPAGPWLLCCGSILERISIQTISYWSWNRKNTIISFDLNIPGIPLSMNDLKLSTGSNTYSAAFSI